MIAQDALFPMSRLEIAQAFLNHFEEEVEKRTKSVMSANDKLFEAQQLRAMAEADVRRAQTAADAPAVVFPPLPLQQPEYGAVDPVTGELAPQTISADVERTCHKCGGEGRLPDKTGGGHHRCGECHGSGSLTETVTVPIVLVAWPDNPDMQTTTVGPLTRYGELAADFLTSLPDDDPRREDSFLDYRIVDVDAGSERDPHAVITASDYGLMLSVEAPAAAVAP